MVGIVTIYFQKGNGDRKELVCDIQFVFDLKEKKFESNLEGEEINYDGDFKIFCRVCRRILWWVSF